MTLHEEFRVQGDWLFRWRSYLPFCLISLIAIAYLQFDWPWHSYLFHEAWEFICLAISLVGLCVRIATVGHTPISTSGRNTRGQVAAALNTTGMYSVVRHPLYLGNFLIGLGISAVLFEWWLPAIYVLAFWLYYERIMFAEEAFLLEEFGEEFASWATATPAFFPKLRRWRRPALRFSMRNALRREYSGMFIVVLGHTAQEFVEPIVMARRLGWEIFWIVFSVGGTLTYLTLRTLNRRTRLLDVPGR
jgi:protein-S-isoprenylcysteine O-methyltransferase Ste14